MEISKKMKHIQILGELRREGNKQNKTQRRNVYKQHKIYKWSKLPVFPSDVLIYCHVWDCLIYILGEGGNITGIQVVATTVLI